MACRKKSWIDRAIADFTKAIQLNSNYTDAYYYRGMAYSDKGDFGHAVADFTKVIEARPDAVVYCYRGMAWLYLEEWEKAKADLIIAKEQGIEKYGIPLPPEIAAMLTPQQ